MTSIQLKTFSQVMSLLQSGCVPDQRIAKVFQHPGEKRDFTDVSVVCLLNGCLAMLNANELVTEYKPGHVFITDVLGSQLLDISDRYVRPQNAPFYSFPNFNSCKWILCSGSFFEGYRKPSPKSSHPGRLCCGRSKPGQ